MQAVGSLPQAAVRQVQLRREPGHAAQEPHVLAKLVKLGPKLRQLAPERSIVEEPELRQLAPQCDNLMKEF